MITVARWCLLLAALHRQPGGVIIAVVLAAVGAEALRKRFAPSPWGAA